MHKQLEAHVKREGLLATQCSVCTGTKVQKLTQKTLLAPYEGGGKEKREGVVAAFEGVELVAADVMTLYSIPVHLLSIVNCSSKACARRTAT
jgi:hypothetical protein